jgi:hypothetical protein
MYNVSPLGYELYLSNYIHIKDKQFMVYAKYGEPFKNNGVGFRWNNLVDSKRWNVATQIDLWEQDIYGSGISGELESKFNLGDKLSLYTSVGYKTKGYVLGKQIEPGINVGAGLVFHANYY